MRLLRVYAAYQCQVVSLQLIVNSDVRHSGEPSCLSLRKRWTPKCVEQAASGRLRSSSGELTQ